MPTLFEFPPTRSNRAKWALEELGIAYDSNIVDFTADQQQSTEHQRRHPLGHVPVLEGTGYSIHESVAIVLQLLDEHPHASLAPAIGSGQRAIYYQWCVFACAELDPALFDLMKHTMHLPDDQRVLAIADRARQRFHARAQVLCSVLSSQEYLLDCGFSGADIAVGYDCNWAAYTGVLDQHPVLLKYYKRLQARPAFRRVFV